jgi:ribosomal-protein-alanine N-acetyltransferase
MTPLEENIEFKTLTRDFLKKNINEIIKIGSDLQDEYWGQQHFLMDLSKKFTLSFVARDKNGKFLAYAICSMKARQHGHLHHFIVDSSFRGKGLGSLIMQEIINRMKQSSAKKLTLKVDSKNIRGIEFYENYGFIVCGTVKNYACYEKKLEKG